jgi:hypothetical protein
MNKIQGAALRWHAARSRRLEIGREKRATDAVKGFGTARLHLEMSERLSQARRLERAALRELAKACADQRGILDQSDVIDLPRLIGCG